MAGVEIHTESGSCPSTDRGGAARWWGCRVSSAVRINVEALVFLNDPAVVADYSCLVPAVQNCDIQTAANREVDGGGDGRRDNGPLRILNLEAKSRSRRRTRRSRKRCCESAIRIKKNCTPGGNGGGRRCNHCERIARRVRATRQESWRFDSNVCGDGRAVTGRGTGDTASRLQRRGTQCHGSGKPGGACRSRNRAVCAVGERV